MKKLLTSLIVLCFFATKLFAGAVTITEPSGTLAAQINTDLAAAVTAGNTDITLQLADGGTYIAASAGTATALTIPAGVTRLVFYAPSTVAVKPVLYVSTLTFSDQLMTELIFDGVKVMTGVSNNYLVQPNAATTKFLTATGKLTFRNCWVEGYRAVLYSTLATTLAEVNYVGNYFKNIAASGIISVSAGTLNKVTIRNNTFNNVGGDASAATGTDYFIDFRSTNSVTSQINFSNNTIYYPRTQGRGLFRTSANFTTGYLKENNNLYATGNSTGYTIQLLYNNLTAGTSTDTDSTNYYSNKLTMGTNKGSILTTAYTENSPSNLFVDPSNDNFTINDPNFAGKTKAGNPACFYPPTITFSGGLVNLDYNLNAGPSAAQSFTISTVVLKGAVTLTAPAHYEISSDNVTFSGSLTLGSAGNDLTNQTVYVRQKAGNALGTYNESITATTTGGATKYLTLSGSVTQNLPVLDTPAGLSASTITYTSFHASWTAVANAASYSIRLLVNGSAVSTVTTSGTSYDFSSLTPGTVYTFAVTAVADGVNYNNSVESTQSASVALPSIYLFSSVNIANAGAVSKTPNYTSYSPNALVTLTATKNFGYAFVNWTDSVSGTVLSSSASYTVTMNETKHIKANFSSVATYNFSVAIAGSPWGKVTLSPAANGGKYEVGTVVTMTVTPNAVTTFSYWEDQTTVTSRNITVSKDTAFTATFDEKPFIAGWDFKASTPTSARTGDYYAVSTNKGIFNIYNQDGTVASWLAHTGAHSPATPCTYKWTDVNSFATNQRYYQASFSTTGYQNIQVKSQMAADYQYYATQKLQASLDGVSFTDLTTASISNTWVDMNYTLPQAYENQSTVYLRWVADASSTKNGAGNDGTSITNVFIFADVIPVPDTTAPTLLSTVPANNAATISANGSIVLTFDEAVKAGTGSCTLNGTALTATYGSKTVSFAYSKLAYNSNYTFVVPSGAIADKSGNAFAGITLNLHTMNRPVPAAKLFDAVIAKDGSGDYTTIQAAIDAAPAGRAIPWLIFVKNGTYSGHVDIPSTKPYINLIGQSRDSVIISAARLSGASSDSATVYSVDPGASVVVKAANCYFENICFENKYGYDHNTGPQALALYTTNDRVILNNCWLRSYQDTYLTAYGNVAYRHYLKNCRIEGAVDFIYGGGDVYFDKCTIFCKRSSGGYIVAPSHQTGTKWGYVFSNCTIDGTDASYTTYLGRPWSNRPMTSFFNTTCKINIYPAGWYYKMGAIPAIFADYNSVDANGFALDLTQRISTYQIDSTKNSVTTTYTYTGIKNSFTDAEAATYTYENVVSGTDSWDPRTIIEPTASPVNVRISSGGVLSWDATQYAICYVITKNNKVIGFSSTNEFTDASYSAAATYKVTAVAESGALSAASTAIAGGPTTGVLDQIYTKPYAYTANKKLVVANLPSGAKVDVYAVNGTLLASRQATASSMSFDFVSPCIIRIKTEKNTDVLKVIK
jgi:hypothetical protein